MRADEINPKKLVVFDIDDTLVYTQTKVHVVKDGKVVNSLNSHDFTHYKLQPDEEFDFGDFRNAKDFFDNSKPNIPMMNQLKRDINTGNKVVMVTARADFDDKELFLDTFRKFGIDMNKVHVYRAGNSKQGTTEERKKAIIKNLLDKDDYTKAIMYDDAKPNLHTFMELKKDHPKTNFYAWHVSLDGNANEYMREGLEEGEFRANDIEEFKPDNDALNDLKSKYLPDWEMLDHRTLQAKYVADDHRAAVAFVKIINSLSEQMDHFCEVTQDVAEVTIKTTTFDVKGLTILDFQIAMVIDRFASDVGIKQVPMSGNFGMHEDIDLDEGIIDSIVDFIKPYIDKAQSKLAKLREAIKREWWETGLMWEIIQKGTKAKDHEIAFANKQFKDMLKTVGLGSWLALPIPGNTLWITLLEKLLNKFDISIMPDSVKQVGVFDGMNENFADGKIKGKSRPGRVKRSGASCKGSVTDLRKRAKNSSGEKAKMYHWCANMKGGKK